MGTSKISVTPPNLRSEEKAFPKREETGINKPPKGFRVEGLGRP